MAVSTLDNLTIGNIGEHLAMLSVALASNTALGAGRMIARSTNAITHVRLCFGTITGTSPVYRVSLQALDGAGLPTGTVLGGGSPASATFTPVAGINEIALANSYTPSLNDRFAVVVEYSSGTIDFSNYAQFIYGIAPDVGVRDSRLTALADLGFGGGWGSSAAIPAMAVKTGSERYGGIVCEFADGISATVRTVSTTGHKVACKFTVPAGWSAFAPSLSVVAMRIAATFTAGQSIKVGIWDAVGSELKAITIDTDFIPSFANTSAAFDSALSVAPGDILYCGIESVSNSDAKLYVLDYDNSDDLNAQDGLLSPGASLAGIYSTWNGSAWTDTAMDVPMVQLVVQDVTIPAAAPATGNRRRRSIICGRAVA